MKIAFVYDPIYPYVIGGGEKRYRELAARLTARGHTAALVGMKYWDGPSPTAKDGVRLVGVCRAIPLYTRRGRRSFVEPFYFAFFVFLHLIVNKYDVVDCGNFPYLPCIAARLALLFRKTKFIVTWLEVWGLKQWLDYAGPAGVAGYFIEKIVSRLTKKNIAISEFTQERASTILGIKPSNVEVVAAGIDLAELDAVAASAKENRIFFAGRLIKTKRVDLLLEAFAAVAPRFPDCGLKIAGDGPERKNLEDIAVRLGIAHRVVFAGFLSRADLMKEMKRSLVFALPSEREGQGIVVLEAMALGTPVVALASPLSAVGKILDGQNGLAAPSAESFASALARLLEDDVLRRNISAAGRLFSENYDWEKSIVPKLDGYFASPDKK